MPCENTKNRVLPAYGGWRNFAAEKIRTDIIA